LLQQKLDLGAQLEEVVKLRYSVPAGMSPWEYLSSEEKAKLHEQYDAQAARFSKRVTMLDKKLETSPVDDANAYKSARASRVESEFKAKNDALHRELDNTVNLVNAKL